MEHSELINLLLNSSEPSVRWKIRVKVLGEERDSPPIRELEKEIAESPRVAALLSKVDKQGRLKAKVYAKWQGAQWVLMTLADIGYPCGMKWLQPTADEVMGAWLTERYFQEFAAESKPDAYKKLRKAIPLMQGRHRVCASQQGNALYAVLALGLEDERIHQLAERLLHWQWPDGGWNCDKELDADTSTFIHTLWAMRGLHLYAQHTGDPKAARAVTRAAEVFLTRKLYKRVRDGRVIREEFIKLHYPLYWHYDILAALKVFAEIGMTGDPRLQDALALLKEKELPYGGWPAESRYYTKVSDQISLGADYVDWGGTSKKKLNEWVTADALYVLKKFGELNI
ncbi:MAG: hypothetical protein KIS85_05940 [Anaerolineales bacterium]|nr:hypothetical protein [Anaerolineales bacterium]